MPVEVTTKAMVREVLGLQAQAIPVASILRSVSASVARYLERELEARAFEVLFDVAPHQCLFSVRFSPLVSVDSIEVLDNEGEVASTLEAADFSFSDHSIELRTPVSPGRRRLRVEGTGGMAESTTDFIERYPDIAYLSARYIALLYRRSKNLEIAGEGAAGAGNTTYLPTTLPEDLREVLDRFRRVSV